MPRTREDLSRRPCGRSRADGRRSRRRHRRAHRDRRAVGLGQEHAPAPSRRARRADEGRGARRRPAVRDAVRGGARPRAQPRARFHLSVPPSAAGVHRRGKRRHAARDPRGFTGRSARAGVGDAGACRPRASPQASAGRAVRRRAPARRARARTRHVAALRARRRADRQSRPQDGGRGVRPVARPESIARGRRSSSSRTTWSWLRAPIARCIWSMGA